MRKAIFITAISILMLSAISCKGKVSEERAVGVRGVVLSVNQKSDFRIESDVADGYDVSDNVFTIRKAGTYDCYGNLYEGQLVVDAGEDEKVTINLNGCTIANSSVSPVNILSADKVEISAKKETENKIFDIRSMTEGEEAKGEETTGEDASGEATGEKAAGAAIYAECDLTLKGNGSLEVISEYNNGIQTKDDLKIKNLTLISEAVNDAIRGNDSVMVESGTVTAISIGSDAIKTSSTNLNKNGEQRGAVTITGGCVVLYAACDGIDSAGDVIISDEAVLSVYTDEYSPYSGEVVAGNDEAGSDVPDTSNPGNMPGNFNPGNKPGNFNPGNMPENFDPGNMPEDFNPGNMPGDFDPGDMPGGFNPGDMPGGFNPGDVPDKRDKKGSMNSEEPEKKVKKNKDSLDEGFPNKNTQTKDSQNEDSKSEVPQNDEDRKFSGNKGNFGERPGDKDRFEDFPDRKGGFGGPMGNMGGFGGMFGEGNEKLDHSCKGIKAGNEILISGGTILVKAKDDGIHANFQSVLESTGEKGAGIIRITGGNITVESGDDGIHADQDLYIKGGDIHVMDSYEGMEANRIFISDGNMKIYAGDDALNANSKGAETAYIEISGGFIDAEVPGGDTDTVDSNSTLLISGGTIFLKNGQMSGSSFIGGTLDMERDIQVTGGTVIAIGCIGEKISGSVYNTSQKFDSGSYEIKDENGSVLMSFILDSSYKAYIFYSDQFTEGETYTVYKDSGEEFTFMK